MLLDDQIDLGHVRGPLVANDEEVEAHVEAHPDEATWSVVVEGQVDVHRHLALLLASDGEVVGGQVLKEEDLVSFQTRPPFVSCSHDPSVLSNAS